MLWRELNSEDFVQPKEAKVEKDPLVHRNLEIRTVDSLKEDDLEEDEGYSYYDE